tara:strand:- start:635 stop:916 length:282 start_codon:yes stop_codon:yes gene_type:complete
MSMKKTTKHFDDLMKCVQQKTLDMSKETVEQKCRETYIKSMSEIIRGVLSENRYADSHLKKTYGLTYKDQTVLWDSFQQLMNDNFDELWGEIK